MPTNLCPKESKESSNFITDEKRFLKYILTELEFFRDSGAYNEKLDYDGTLDDILIHIRSRMSVIDQLVAQPV